MVALFAYESTVKANVTRMETLLHTEFHHMALGRRLWRRIGAGSKFASAEEAAGRKVLHKVVRELKGSCQIGEGARAHPQHTHTPFPPHPTLSQYFTLTAGGGTGAPRVKVNQRV